MEFEQLLLQRKKLSEEEQKMWQCLYSIQGQQKTNKQHIKNTCQHNWIRDPNYTPAPYEKADNVCTICGYFDYE